MYGLQYGTQYSAPGTDSIRLSRRWRVFGRGHRRARRTLFSP